jgi:RNA polymerase sigma factor (sigma-70 family)
VQGGFTLITEGETPSFESGQESLLTTWEAIFKKLVFIECTQIAESAVTFHQGFVSQSELDDLKQDALEQLWEFIEETISCSERFKANAKTAIQTRLKQSTRSFQRQQEVVHQLKTLDIGFAQSPNQHLERLELTRLLDEALVELDVNQVKTLAKLHGLGNSEQLKIKQVATELNISRQTVTNRRKGAYRQLRNNKSLQSLVS